MLWDREKELESAWAEIESLKKEILTRDGRMTDMRQRGGIKMKPMSRTSLKQLIIETDRGFYRVEFQDPSRHIRIRIEDQEQAGIIQELSIPFYFLIDFWNIIKEKIKRNVHFRGLTR